MKSQTYWNEDLVTQLKSGSLDSELITHETLLNLSWDVLNNSSSLEEAIATLKELLKNYHSKSTSDEANDLLLQGYVEILFYFKELSSAKTLDKLLREFPRIKYNFKNLLKTHYGYNILEKEPSEKQSFLDKPIFANF